ncbi:MAG TPA: nucleotide exchange factor GrpE [Balneolaceae bacterium]|nr:nucleotide exchange factor GrpE [Balneolaceae bacterium]|tara:strand:- start:110872 stop:111501 length:630 start_codon:yes stop_codon:yes gene_type:complete
MSKKDHKENKTAEAELNKETQNTEETAELNEQEIEESNEVVEEAASEDATNNNEESEQVALIEKLEKELNDTKDSLLRKAAELENVRKRVQRERITLFEDAKISALQEFLPISEDMKRTLDASEGSEIDKSFLEGVKMVASKFDEVLNRYGVERIDDTGVPFDVNIHDAMLRQPAPDKKTKSDTVLNVLESGYKIGDRVIKHAKVIVSE